MKEKWNKEGKKSEKEEEKYTEGEKHKQMGRNRKGRTSEGRK